MTSASLNHLVELRLGGVSCELLAPVESGQLAGQLTRITFIQCTFEPQWLSAHTALRTLKMIGYLHDGDDLEYINEEALGDVLSGGGLEHLTTLYLNNATPAPPDAISSRLRQLYFVCASKALDLDAELTETACGLETLDCPLRVIHTSLPALARMSALERLIVGVHAEDDSRFAASCFNSVCSCLEEHAPALQRISILSPPNSDRKAVAAPGPVQPEELLPVEMRPSLLRLRQRRPQLRIDVVQPNDAWRFSLEV